jgi:hypothetical protein
VYIIDVFLLLLNLVLKCKLKGVDNCFLYTYFIHASSLEFRMLIAEGRNHLFVQIPSNERGTQVPL